MERNLLASGPAGKRVTLRLTVTYPSQGGTMKDPQRRVGWLVVAVGVVTMLTQMFRERPLTGVIIIGIAFGLWGGLIVADAGNAEEA